jgi:GNAT superfamily N-acetyltransferase
MQRKAIQRMNLNRNFRVRIAMAKDLGRILDLEIKTQEYATEMDHLKTYVVDVKKIGFIVSLGNRDIGYALCALADDKSTDGFVTRMIVGRLGVHPDFRNMGASKSLMSHISKRALNDRCHSIAFSVPSYKIDDPTDPDYIGWWFESMELKAAHVETDFYFRYGKQWDAYIFEAIV